MLIDLLESDGFRLTRKTATEFSSPCPWCGGNDRFTVFTNEDRFWCRQCDKKGDALQYLRDFRRMTFPEAAAMVGKGVSALAKHTRTTTTAPTEPTKVQPPQWRKRAAAGIERAHNNLMKNPEALAWLFLERGITATTAERFRLGWIEKDLFFQKSEFGLPDDGKVLVVPAGLVIPWQDKRIRIRRNHDEDTKKYGRYHVVIGSDTEPMTIGSPYETTAIIVESELDAILLFQEVKRPLFIVAMGSAQVKPGPELLKQLSFCPVVLVALDNDTAGAKAASWWTENVPGASRTLTPRQYGKDFTEAFKNGLGLDDWMCAAMTVFAEQLLKSEGYLPTGQTDPWEGLSCQ